jgi:hypothetical protein
MSTRPDRHPWLENLFRPLVIGVMFGCIALSLVEFVRLFFSAWNGTYLVLVCVLAAGPSPETARHRLAAFQAHRSGRALPVGQDWELRGRELDRCAGKYPKLAEPSVPRL